MESLYLLIPLSAVLVLAILGVFGWALFGGQFEDLEGEGDRILAERSSAQTTTEADAQAEGPHEVHLPGQTLALDVHQAEGRSAPKESGH